MRSFILPALLRLALWIACGLLVVTSASADTASEFEAANKLYEQGKYREAAAAYEKIADAGKVSPAIYFNLANAYFKAGQSGRAMYHLHQARRLAPRDPDIQGNLQFIRAHVYGGKPPTSQGWRSALQKLSLDEWAKLAGASLWLWCSLLCLGQWRDTLKRALGGYTAASGGLFVALAVCLFAAAHDRRKTELGIVITPEAIVRYGPLEESQTAFTVRDGMELVIVDRKDKWVQVTTPADQVGWLPEDKLIRLGN